MFNDSECDMVIVISQCACAACPAVHLSLFSDIWWKIIWPENSKRTIKVSELQLETNYGPHLHGMGITAVDPRVSIFGLWHGSAHTWRTVHRCLLPSPVRLSPIPLTSGIPQGSGLGPTMFISYSENTTPIFFHAHRPISSVCWRYSILWPLTVLYQQFRLC